MQIILLLAEEEAIVDAPTGTPRFSETGYKVPSAIRLHRLMATPVTRFAANPDRYPPFSGRCRAKIARHVRIVILIWYLYAMLLPQSISGSIIIRHREHT